MRRLRSCLNNSRLLYQDFSVNNRQKLLIRAAFSHPSVASATFPTRPCVNLVSTRSLKSLEKDQRSKKRKLLFENQPEKKKENTTEVYTGGDSGKKLNTAGACCESSLKLEPYSDILFEAHKRNTMSLSKPTK